MLSHQLFVITQHCKSLRFIIGLGHFEQQCCCDVSKYQLINLFENHEKTQE